MTENQTKGARTRQAILEAAFTLFCKQGFSGTSMRAIAAEAGLALGGIYNHFANKEEIFKAAVLTYHPFVTVLPKVSLSEGETAENLLRHAAHLLVAELDQHPDLFNLLFIELIELKGQHLPEMATQLAPHMLEFMQRVQAADETIRPLPPIVAMRAFLSTLLGYIITQMLLQKTPIGQVMDGELDNYLNLFFSRHSALE